MVVCDVGMRERVHGQREYGFIIHHIPAMCAPGIRHHTVPQEARKTPHETTITSNPTTTNTTSITTTTTNNNNQQKHRGWGGYGAS